MNHKPRIIIVKDFSYPSTTANAVQVIKMAEALSRIAHTQLWCPKAKTDHITWNDIAKDYDCLVRFTLVQIPCWFVHYRTFLFRAIASYGFKISFYVAGIWRLIRSKPVTAIYSREPEIIVLNALTNWLLHRNIKNIFAIHQLPDHWYDWLFFNGAIRLTDHCVVISKALQHNLSQRGVTSVVLPDGVEESWLEPVTIRSEPIRLRYHLPRGNLILYAGSKVSWKGITVFKDSAWIDDHPDHHYIMVGFKETEPGRVISLDRIGRKALKQLYQVADCLVIPNTALNETSRLFTSPLKLFEYMAMRKPIIASDTPALREIISEREAWFFEADNPRALLKTIDRVLRLPQSKKRAKVNAAFKVVKHYTWEKRANHLMKLIDV